jgi:surfeit locus 1 family protein
MKIKILRREMRVHLAWLAVYLLLTALLLRLGFWQLQRSEQKRDFLARQEQALVAPPLALNDRPQLTLAEGEYRQVNVRGQYDYAHQLLIDNQIVDAKAGYWVMTPFLPDGQSQAILVNRGWVAANAERRQLPDIGFHDAVQAIQGRINHFPEPGIKLAGGGDPGNDWPAVVQYIDVASLAGHLGYAVRDFQIELDTQQPGGYLRRWKVGATISPEKHLGYAVQWFGLAAALSGLFLWLSMKNSRE